MTSLDRAAAVAQEGTEATLPGLLEARARARPGAPALLAPGRDPLDYTSLFEHVRELARELGADGVKPDDRVAIVLPNGPELAVAFLGVAACAVSVPLDPGLAPEELERRLGEARAVAVLVEAGVEGPALAAARRLDLRVLRLVRENGRAGACRLESREPVADGSTTGATVGPSAVATLVYTAGTTGTPRLVALAHDQLCASARTTASTLQLGPEDRALNVLPLVHVHGLVASLLATLSAGGSVVCAAGFTAPDFFSAVAELGPTWYSTVPAVHRAIADEGSRQRDPLARGRLRFVRSSAEPLPTALARELESLLGVPVVEAYGMTEAAHQVASNPLPPRLRVAGSVGRATGARIEVVRDARTVGPGEEGEIVVHGPTVVDRYEDSGPAAEAFAGGRLRTGDLGYLDTQGYLFLTGRLKGAIGSETERPAGATPPRTPLEARIAHLWARVLGLDQVGVEDLFAELGGDAAAAARLTAAIDRELGLELAPEDLLGAPTVARQATLVDRELRSRTHRG